MRIADLLSFNFGRADAFGSLSVFPSEKGEESLSHSSFCAAYFGDGVSFAAGRSRCRRLLQLLYANRYQRSVYEYRQCRSALQHL